MRTYLQEFIDFNLSVLVDVHLVKDFVEGVLVDVDVDALRQRVVKTAEERRRGHDGNNTHFQHLLHVHGGDESFAVFVKLVEALLVPAEANVRSTADITATTLTG